MKIWSRMLCIFFFVPMLNYAQFGGQGTYHFLELPNSARVASMGGNLISIQDDDLNLPFHNPALLNPEMSRHLVLNYVNYFMDIKFGYVAYAQSFGKCGNIAAGIHYINYGKFISADELGFRNGEFKAAEYALNLIWSKWLIDSVLTIGVNIKPILSNLENYTSYGIASDVGIHYFNKPLLLGISFVARNIGTQIKPYYEGNYESIPYDLQIGFSKRLAHAPFRFSILAQHLQTWDMSYDELTNSSTQKQFGTVEPKNKMAEMGDNLLRHTIFGVEFLPGKNFNVRFGYNHQRRNELKIDDNPGFVGFSWGFGLKISKFNFSYGRASYFINSISNHFSMAINLSEMRFKRKK
jgi:hypothetical protein